MSLAAAGNSSNLNMTTADAVQKSEGVEVGGGDSIISEGESDQQGSACYSSGMQCDIIVYAYGKAVGSELGRESKHADLYIL